MLPDYTTEPNLDPFDRGFLYHPLSDDRGRYTFSDVELHDHSAQNALARGHAATCLTVTRPVNWPTLFGRPACTC